MIKISGQASGVPNRRAPQFNPRVAASITRGLAGARANRRKEIRIAAQMRALGQEQKERGEIRSDVKAGQRDRKEERERERRKKKKGRPLSPHPLCRRWTLTPPLFDEPRAGFLNFVTFKFKHSHLLRSRPAQCLCLLPMPILSLFCVVFFSSLLLPRSLSCSLIS